jgi:hypothetical protein
VELGLRSKINYMQRVASSAVKYDTVGIAQGVDSVAR